MAYAWLLPPENIVLWRGRHFLNLRPLTEFFRASRGHFVISDATEWRDLLVTESGPGIAE